MPDIKGIVGEKLGMTQIFVETRAVPVTVIKAGPCVVTQIRTQANDGYDAVQLAYGTMRPRDVSKPTQGHFDKAGAEPARYVVELRTDNAGTYEPGQQITVDAFEAGEKVDVVGVSKGKGFSGVMKRHGFAGLRSSHGVHKKHRSPGAIGACATPSRVFKGMRMAGQTGNQRTTVLNLEVVQSDPERGLLLVKGAVPGPNGGLVMVRSAVKTPLKAGAQKGAA
jgi:large subunit ribosomal protein L3